jgi:tRNA G18 (ribose-2'-O)-methylase SpoU
LIDTVVENGKPLFLILDQISDARNLVQSSELLNVLGKWYYSTKKQVQLSKWRYRKTSAGAVFNIPICSRTHQRRYLSFASERN